MPIFSQYMQGQRLGMDQGKNMLARDQALEQREREQGLRNILAGAYQQPTPAIPALPPEMQEGPVQPMETMPYPAQEAQPGRMDIQSMLGSMYEGGYGPEAMAYEQKMATGRDKTPANVLEFEYLKKQFPDKQWSWSDYQDMKRQGWTIQDIANVPTRVSITPDRPADAGGAPISTIEQEVESKAAITKGQKLGEIAGAQIKSAMDMIPKLTSNIGNLQEVVRLVEKEGASTGPLMARLPSFRQSSIELDNMQKQLGLDVIGSVTFGALSKGELDLAMSKALPTHLQGDDLIDWANRKIEAQEKLKDYFSEQAQYLSQPNATVAGWLEKIKGGSASPKTPNTQAEYDALPSGTVYIDPDDNKQYRKP